MGKYILKRIASAIVTIFVISFVVFFLIHMTSGDPAMSMLGSSATMEEVDALREKLGLNQPLIKQYIDWLADAINGDLGESYFQGENVTEIIQRTFPVSLEMVIYAEIISIAISLVVGVLAAKHKGGVTDVCVTSLSLFGMSIPPFVLSVVIVLIFGVVLKALPVSGYAYWSEGADKHIRYLILPVLTLVLGQIPLMIRMTKSAVQETMASEYVKSAKAKGLSSNQILFKHALKNAMNTILTVIGQSLGALIAGTMIVESLFVIPGIGQILNSSIGKRDYPIIQAATLLISIMCIGINLVVDLLYGVLDPRIQVEKK